MDKKDYLRISAVAITALVLVTSAMFWSIAPKEETSSLNKAPAAKSPESGVGVTYEAAMQEDKPFVALFYTTWCTYCKRFMPRYKTLEEIYDGKYNFVTINAEDPAYIEVANDYAIGGYPTLYIIDPKIDNRVLISNTLYDNTDRLKGELDRYLRVRAK